jgi:hypothetical protein
VITDEGTVVRGPAVPAATASEERTVAERRDT